MMPVQETSLAAVLQETTAGAAADSALSFETTVAPDAAAADGGATVVQW
jgi:hypothetical protein